MFFKNFNPILHGGAEGGGGSGAQSARVKFQRFLSSQQILLLQQKFGARGGGGVFRSGFAGYVPLASQNPYPIIIYSVTNYRPHLSHF